MLNTPTTSESELFTEYPLEREWVVWFNGPARTTSKPLPRGKKPESLPPRRLGSFKCIKTMWEWMNILPLPERVADEGNISIFQLHVDPLWEHPANVNGGRWMYSIPTSNTVLAAAAWQSLYLGLVGETLDHEFEIVGIILARRHNYTRLSVWTRDRLRADAITLIGKRIKAGLPEAVGLEYQDHGAPFGEYRHAM